MWRGSLKTIKKGLRKDWIGGERRKIGSPVKKIVKTRVHISTTKALKAVFFN